MKADEFLEVLDGINLKYINEVLQPASRKNASPLPKLAAMRR